MKPVCATDLRTLLSRPWICNVTDLAFLLEEFRKNWDFVFFRLSGERGRGLAGAFRMSKTSCAKAVMSTEMPFLQMKKKCDAQPI